MTSKHRPSAENPGTEEPYVGVLTRVRRWAHRIGPIEVFTLVLVIFTGIQVCVFVESESAFVFPTKADFAAQPIAGEKYLTLYLDLKNSGRDAAAITELRAAITHGPLPTKPQYQGAAQFAIPPVAANGEIRQTLQFLTAWPQQTVDDVESGHLAFYIFGVFRYRDLYKSIDFVGEKESGFCFVYVPNKTDPAKAVFRTCREPAYTYAR